MAGIIKSHLQLGDSVTASNNFMVTAQAADGTMKVARGNNGATTQDIITVDAAGLVTLSQGRQLTLGTAQATTSGTSIDFTGIPSWVKRVTVMLNGVGTSGVSIPIIQIGSNGVETTGYSGDAIVNSSTNSTAATIANGLPLSSTNTPTYSYRGHVVLTLVGANIWVSSGVITTGSGQIANVAGTKTTSGVLDRIRLTTVNGTDIFDAGSVNILYEG